MTTGADGRATQVLRHGDPVTVSVSAEGLANARLVNPSFPATIRLDGGQQVTIVFADAGIPVLEGVNRYRLLLRSADAEIPTNTGQARDLMRSFMGNGALQKNAEPGTTSVTLDSVTPGRYIVQLVGIPDFGRGNGPPGGRNGRNRDNPGAGGALNALSRITMVDYGTIEVTAGRGLQQVTVQRVDG
jgi:hypothetical protein